MVEPKSTFTYDALYRLTKAEGREHLSLNNPVISNYELDKYCFTFDNANSNDLQALANYERNYQYDQNNNLIQIQHQTLGAGNTARNFTRDILPADGSNKAVPTDMLTGGAVPEDFFDANGNCINLDHLETIEYNYRDNISKVKKNGVSDYEYYIYNSSGDRVRKITVVGSEVTEKIYLGGVEIKKISSGSSLILERWDHHVMDDTSRIAIVNYWETDTLNREVNDASEIGVHKIRYQYGNHLGSASLELDDSGNVISYEEYFPYGGSSFMYGDNLKEVKLKEYRFTGKERDEFTGLYYFGARYYAPWIGRWMSADPAGVEGSGLNLYWYGSDNPVRMIDPNGMSDEDKVNVDNDAYAKNPDFDFETTEIDKTATDPSHNQTFGRHLTREQAHDLSKAIKKFVAIAKVGNAFLSEENDRDLTLQFLDRFMSGEGGEINLSYDVIKDDPAFKGELNGLPKGLKSPNERAEAYFNKTMNDSYHENFPERAEKYAGTGLDLGFEGDLATSLGGVGIDYKIDENNRIHGKIDDVYTFNDNPEQDLSVSFTTNGQPDGTPLLGVLGWEGGSTISDEWMGDMERYGFAKKFHAKVNWSFQKNGVRNEN